MTAKQVRKQTRKEAQMTFDRIGWKLKLERENKKLEKRIVENETCKVFGYMTIS